MKGSFTPPPPPLPTSLPRNLPCSLLNALVVLICFHVLCRVARRAPRSMFSRQSQAALVHFVGCAAKQAAKCHSLSLLGEGSLNQAKPKLRGLLLFRTDKKKALQLSQIARM